MANYRSCKAEELVQSLNKARASIRAEYMNYLGGREVDLANVEAQNSAVIDITKALIDKHDVPSEEDQALNLEIIRLCREMKGLPPFINFVRGEHSSSSAPVTTPKERIPRFSGELREYARFKLVFDALVDRNAQLDDETRERLLVQHLDGKAMDLISPFIGLPNAYQMMRRALVEEFEDASQLKNHLKAELEKLPKINDKYDDRMHDFRNVVNWVYGAAKQSPVISEDFQRTLLTMVVGKFSEKIMAEIAKKCFNLTELLELFARWRKEKENMLAFGILKSHNGRHNERHEEKRNSVRTVAAGKTGRSCYFCRGEHFTDKCNEPPEPRKCKEIAAERHLCFVCLRKGHLASDQSCPRFGVKCRSCQRGKHHPFLCVPTEQRSDITSSRDDPPRDPAPPSTPLCAVGVVNNLNRYEADVGNIGTAMVNGPPEHYFLGAELNGERIRILLDSGSDVSLIERRLVDDPAHLFRGPKQLVSGLGGTEETNEMCKLELAGDGVPPIGLCCYVLNELPGVNVIIGRYEMPLLLKNEMLDQGRLYFETVFGRVYVSDRNEPKFGMAKCNRAALVDELPVQPLLTELVGVETDPEILSEVEQRADGRFGARLPLLPERKRANNYSAAKHRQERLQQRLQRIGIKEIYRDQLSGYDANGHAIPVLDRKYLWTEEDTPAKAEQIKVEAQEIFASAGLELTKRNNSDGELKSKWNAKRNTDILMVVGIPWSPESETRSMKCPPAPNLASITSRKMKFIGGKLDVIGMEGPAKLFRKNITENVIVPEVKWDDAAPEPFAPDFRGNVEPFGRLAELFVPRHVPTKCNPADHDSRPKSVTRFMKLETVNLGVKLNKLWNEPRRTSCPIRQQLEVTRAPHEEPYGKFYCGRYKLWSASRSMRMAAGRVWRNYLAVSRSLRTSDMTMNVSTLGRSVPMSMNE